MGWFFDWLRSWRKHRESSAVKEIRDAIPVCIESGLERNEYVELDVPDIHARAEMFLRMISQMVNPTAKMTAVQATIAATKIVERAANFKEQDVAAGHLDLHIATYINTCWP